MMGLPVAIVGFVGEEYGAVVAVDNCVADSLREFVKRAIQFGLRTVIVSKLKPEEVEEMFAPYETSSRVLFFPSGGYPRWVELMEFKVDPSAIAKPEELEKG
jgi:hypothetical protein